MSKISSFAKSKFVLKMIDNIEMIIQRHGNITKALEDIEGQMALMMALLQMGESLNKIDNDILEKFDLVEEVKGAYYVRNFIAHDYEGVNLAIVEDILRNRLVSLKEKVLKIEEYFENDTD